MSSSKILVCWDFDWTLINENSDTYVIKELAGNDEYQHMKTKMKEMQWTKLMDYECQRLTTAPFSKTQAEIQECMATIPVFEENLKAIRLISADPNCVQCIVSDANTEFIQAFLQRHDLVTCFQEIHTNPSTWSEGVLSVAAYHHNHGCPRCVQSPNMCKGQIVDDIVNRLGSFERIIYLGDGRGDVCGCSRLQGNDDVVLARHEYALQKLIKEGNSGVTAHVMPWSSGAEILSVLEGQLSSI